MTTDSEKISAYLSHIQSWMWGYEHRSDDLEQRKEFIDAVSLMVNHFGKEKIVDGILRRMKKDISSLDVYPVMPFHSHFNGDEKIVRKIDPLEVSEEFKKKIGGYSKGWLGNILSNKGNSEKVISCLQPLFAFDKLWKTLKEKHPDVLSGILEGIRKNSELNEFLSVGSGKEVYPFFKEWKMRPWEKISNKWLFEKEKGHEDVKDVHGLVCKFRKTTGFEPKKEVHLAPEIRH